MKEKSTKNQVDYELLQSRMQLKMAEEMTGLYQSEEKARRSMSDGQKKLIRLGLLLLLFLAVSLFLMPYGLISTPVSDGFSLPHFGMTPATYRNLVIERGSSFFNFITASGSYGMGRIIFSLLVTILAGSAMSAAGAVYQGVFTNPMASPTTLGVQSGGMLAGIIYIWFFYDTTAVGSVFANGEGSFTVTTANELIAYWQSMSIFERCAQQFFTLAGCFAGVALVVGIAMLAGRGKISTVALLLAGSVFSSLITEAGQLVQYYLTMYSAEDDLRVNAINTLTGGSYIGDGFTWYEFLFMLIPCGICLIILISLAGRLNIMVFGKDEARAMGVSVTGFRNILIAASTILSAVVLSFCGQVAMVGFMVPHFARYLVGPDFRKLIPASVLLGGITTLLIYDVCYITAQLGRFNLYTGIVCSIMSVIFFAFFRRNRNADWS